MSKNICTVCGKKMPPHIIEKHMAKSHPNVKETKEVKPEPQITPEAVSIEAPTHLEFDWNKAETCASCGQVHPSLLMRYHAHTEHGV